MCYLYHVLALHVVLMHWTVVVFREFCTVMNCNLRCVKIFYNSVLQKDVVLGFSYAAQFVLCHCTTNAALQFSTESAILESQSVLFIVYYVVQRITFVFFFCFFCRCCKYINNICFFFVVLVFFLQLLCLCVCSIDKQRWV